MPKNNAFFPLSVINRNDPLILLSFASELGLLYGVNPKCACSSIKASIWRKLDQVNGTANFHRNKVHAGVPFTSLKHPTEDQVESAIKATAFSAVRNPYRRALSAYLDKIGSNRHDKRVWAKIAQRYNLRPEVTSDELSFKDFLKILDKDDLVKSDPHFRPQHYNLFIGRMRWDSVCRLEEKSELEDLLKECGLEPYRNDHHKTGSAENLDLYFDDETIDLVKRIYRFDFKFFGYSADISNPHPIRKVSIPDHDGSVYDLLRRKPLRSSEQLSGHEAAVFSILSSKDVDKNTSDISRIINRPQSLDSLDRYLGYLQWIEKRPSLSDEQRSRIAETRVSVLNAKERNLEMITAHLNDDLKRKKIVH